MNAPSELALTEQARDEISRHAAETFPEECCGIILHNGRSYEVHRCKNIQNQLRALDPETYPRTAATAYAMDPKELEAVLQEAETRGARITAFYHSHPEHEAYFSAEDRAFAMPFGEPTFPEAAQIVISIYNGTVRRISAYVWSEEKKDFIEIPVRKS
ncbi:MAG: M67 family metallopeptidase [Deltaproteobacteria bacterium]|nr:M67 family metallopeptidase [Deltaproteobacteria bacterium]